MVGRRESRTYRAFEDQQHFGFVRLPRRHNATGAIQVWAHAAGTMTPDAGIVRDD